MPACNSVVPANCSGEASLSSTCRYHQDIKRRSRWEGTLGMDSADLGPQGGSRPPGSKSMPLGERSPPGGFCLKYPCSDWVLPLCREHGRAIAPCAPSPAPPGIPSDPPSAYYSSYWGSFPGNWEGILKCVWVPGPL